MKKLLYIFLTISLLSFTVLPAYVHAEEEVTTISETEETVAEENTTAEEETTLADTLEEEEETDDGVTVWTVLVAVLGASLFFGVGYYIIKNFNL